MIDNGYYLFVYSEIDELFNVIGLSLRHDHNMALFKKTDSNIELVCHLEFERFSGIKHHNVAFFSREDAIEYIDTLLSPYNVTLDDIKMVYGMPGLQTRNCLISSAKHNDIAQHAVYHLFTSLILDTEEFYDNDIIALAFDGGPDSLSDSRAEEKYYYCGAYSANGNIDVFPIMSPGPYWAYASHYFGIPEGTLMALAYATEARSIVEYDEFPDYMCNKNKITVTESLNKMLSDIMSYKIEPNSIQYINYDSSFTETENKISMIVKIIQEISIKKVYKTIEYVLAKYSLDPHNTMIALSGGYALNCPTNTDIMHKYHFKKQLCCPCVNDGGLAIGMGIRYFLNNGTPFSYQFKNAFYGSEDNYSQEIIFKEYFDFIHDIRQGVENIAEDIEKEPVLWFYGRAEIGPRALGHRSIFANPMKVSHKDLLNTYKEREWWRPVAPIVLYEHLEMWFEEPFYSPYMLNNFKVTADKAELIPAVIHMDLTARVQTVTSEDDAMLYDVVNKFYKLTGVPVICNTSLNGRGEPIINSLQQLFNFALRKNIRIIYFNGMRVELKNHEQYSANKYEERNHEPFTKHRGKKADILKQMNPYMLSKKELLIYKYNPLLQKYSLSNENDVRTLKRILSKINKFSTSLNGLELIGADFLDK